MLYRIISRLPVYRASYQALKHLSEITTHTKQNYEKGNKSFLNFKNVVVGVGIIVGGSVGYYLVDKLNNKYDGKPGSFNPKLPVYTLEEISSHDSMEKGVWVIYKQGVYDITDFISGHPGGEQILMAAGSSVEPFWMLYGVHQTPEVSAIFETYRMGNVRAGETKHLTSDMSDPYAYEPKRHFALIPASAKPFNAELPSDILIQNFITPNELFYVRNHLPVPEIDPKTYELEIEIEGKDETLVFTLDELKKMPKRTITATIMCAGNRRSDMIKHKPVRGLNWGAAAVGTATWTGVPLRDILLQAGINEDEEEYKHIQFEGIDADVTAKNYGASIPIWKALDKRGDVILAYEMNGVPIPRDHGFPVRVIVPGVVGARNVKWLGRIVVSDKESDSHWQQNDYKGFSPSVDWDTVDFTKSPAIQELPVISAICKPSQGSTINVEKGVINVKGYAWSGGGQQIVRVDVTADGGKTWHVANFDHQDSVSPPRHWAWTLWSVNIPVDQEATSVEIWSKAVDSAYNTQPESVQHIWNLRGVLSNAYHRIKVNLKRMDN